MFTKEDVIEDPCTDDVGKLIKAMGEIKTWTKVKHGLLNDLETLLKSRSYIYLSGRLAKYHISCVGTSCLYQIPANRRGKLSVFRGKLIRLVCIQTGRYDRGYRAGIYPQLQVAKDLPASYEQLAK